MGSKCFTEYNGLKLLGDERDVMCNYVDRNEIWDWSEKNKILLQFQGSLGYNDLWRIRDEKQRVWFMLKWG